MLGKVVHDIKELPSESPYSTKLVDAILEHWKEEWKPVEVTLKKKDPIWQEWWIYASSVHKMCPKMYALMAAHGIEDQVSEVINAETLFNFKQGKLYHELFQREILSSFPKGVLLGRWKRRNKLGDDWTIYRNKVLEGMMLERGWGPCPEGDNWVYDEPKIRIPEYRIVVKLDGILKWPDEDDVYVVEIKTEKSSAKDSLNPRLGGKPRESHVQQAHIGMWATGSKKAIILYVFKGERSLRTSIIEHVIDRDESIIDNIKLRASLCVEAVKQVENIEKREDRIAFAKEFPKLEECKLKSKGKPRYCDGRDFCFGVRKKSKKG